MATTAPVDGPGPVEGAAPLAAPGTVPAAEQHLRSHWEFAWSRFRRDRFALAGGVIVSYFEWVQNLQQHPWSLEKVNTELREKMTVAYNGVRDIVREKKVPWRTAAYVIALGRVAEAERLRGH